MNLAHIHLILNHVPVIGIPVALLFLIHGVWTRNISVQRFSLVLLCALAIVVLPVYLSGEPAEKVVEHQPGVTEAVIEPHEEAAEVSLIITLISGAAALGACFLLKSEKWSRTSNLAVIAMATVATLSLVYTASLGGQVRHTELRSGNRPQQTEAPH